jgi:hypothetical protein
MAAVRIRAGHPSEVMHDERRADVQALARSVGAMGNDVELDIVERVEGRLGLTLVEWVFMFVGSSVSGAIINNVTSDLYDAAKRWARERHRKKKATGGGRPIGFVIYGPAGEELRSWDTREDDKGEDHESDGNQP